MSRAISFFSYSTLACGAHDLQRPVEVGHARAGRVLPRFAEVVVLLPGDVAQHDDLVVLPHARGARSGGQCERDHRPESTPLARPRTTAAVIARMGTPAARGVKPRPRDVKDRAAALRGLLGQREHPAAHLARRDLGPPSACARRSVEARCASFRCPEAPEGSHAGFTRSPSGCRRSNASFPRSPRTGGEKHLRGEGMSRRVAWILAHATRTTTMRVAHATGIE